MSSGVDGFIIYTMIGVAIALVSIFLCAIFLYIYRDELGLEWCDKLEFFSVRYDTTRGVDPVEIGFAIFKSPAITNNSKNLYGINPEPVYAPQPPTDDELVMSDCSPPNFPKVHV